MATVKSMTVTLKNNGTFATLPDNRVMRYGVDYVIALEDYAKISDWAKSNVINVSSNTSNTIVPLWNSADYALDLLTINDKADIDTLNADNQAAKVFALGDVISGFGDDLFMLVTLKDDAAAPSTSTSNVAVWSDRDAHEVSVNTSAETGDFAGVLVGATTGGYVGWLQITGIVPEVAANAIVKAADSVVVSADDGQLTDLAQDEIQTITLPSPLTEARDTFKLTYNGTESSAITYGVGGGATAANLQTAIRGLLAADHPCKTTLTVSGTTNVGPFTVTFVGGEVNELPITVTSGNAAVNEQWTIDRNGASSGDFDIVIKNATGTAQTASAVAWNVSVGDLQTALNGLSNLADGDVVVSAGTGDDLILTYSGGTQAGKPIAADAVVITDNTDATVAATRTTIGNTATTGVVTETPRGGTSAGGTVVGTALSDSSASLAEVKLNALTPTGNHKRRRNLFFDK